jgi:hypothetical protein
MDRQPGLKSRMTQQQNCKAIGPRCYSSYDYFFEEGQCISRVSTTLGY